MRLCKVIGLTFAILAAHPTNAISFQVCEARAMMRVQANSSPDSFLKPGEKTNFTSYDVSTKDGTSQICSHGGHCWPVISFRNGKKEKLIELLNCKIGKPTGKDKDTEYFEVEPIRSMIAPIDFKRYDAEIKLSQMGVCSACSGGAALIYVTEPNSACAREVEKALKGNKEARRRLKDSESACDQ